MAHKKLDNDICRFHYPTVIDFKEDDRKEESLCLKSLDPAISAG
jgi:hypothetical protein